MKIKIGKNCYIRKSLVVENLSITKERFPQNRTIPQWGYILGWGPIQVEISRR